MTVRAAAAGGHPGLRATTLNEAFQACAERLSDQVALRTPGGAREITWREYADRVRRLAAGLAGLGIGRGDTVAIMLRNRPEMFLVDTAALHLGAVPYSVYNTSSPGQIEHLFADAGSRIVVTEGRFLDTVLSIQAPALRHVVVADEPRRGTMSLAQLEAGGERDFDFGASWRAARPGDIATLIYTSGTTGPPKGVQLTHGNLLFTVRSMSEVVPVRRAGRTVSWLPFAHIADRVFSHYAQMLAGSTVTVVPEPAQILDVLPDARPTHWAAVPRTFEKLVASLEAAGIADPAALAPEAAERVRTGLGLDDADWLSCGAAPVGREVLEYLSALGLPVCEAWGMSETCGLGTMNPRADIRLGTVGRALPGVELDVAPDGELLVRGPNVMVGYRGDPARTAAALAADGWLRTGDLAEIDRDGFVRIVGRKKELIINSSGKSMSVVGIEQRLKAASSLIGYAFAIGDRRPYNTALVVLDPEAAAAYAREHGLSGSGLAAVAQDPGVRRRIEEAVQRANAQLSRVEQIRRHAILPADWLPGSDELTPTMKLRRAEILKKYAAEIEALYAAPGS